MPRIDRMLEFTKPFAYILQVPISNLGYVVLVAQIYLMSNIGSPGQRMFLANCFDLS